MSIFREVIAVIVNLDILETTVKQVIETENSVSLMLQKWI